MIKKISCFCEIYFAKVLYNYTTQPFGGFMMKFLLLSFCVLCSCSHSEDYNSRNNAQSEDQSADWAITTRVKSAIMTDSYLKTRARFVSVSTTDGVVTLTGTVPTQNDGDRIVDITRNVRGVRRVNNQMTISNQ